eukprot:m.480217 g.480217  ORF g.480217 m.480217 type:complete len:350 (-) comp21741_c0_seq1:127-1176(-)
MAASVDLDELIHRSCSSQPSAATTDWAAAKKARQSEAKRRTRSEPNPQNRHVRWALDRTVVHLYELRVAKRRRKKANTNLIHVCQRFDGTEDPKLTPEKLFADDEESCGECEFVPLKTVGTSVRRSKTRRSLGTSFNAASHSHSSGSSDNDDDGVDPYACEPVLTSSDDECLGSDGGSPPRVQAAAVPTIPKKKSKKSRKKERRQQQRLEARSSKKGKGKGSDDSAGTTTTTTSTTTTPTGSSLSESASGSEVDHNHDDHDGDDRVGADQDDAPAVFQKTAPTNAKSTAATKENQSPTTTTGTPPVDPDDSDDDTTNTDQSCPDEAPSLLALATAPVVKLLASVTTAMA